jgi:hypothetical protein
LNHRNLVQITKSRCSKGRSLLCDRRVEITDVRVRKLQDGERRSKDIEEEEGYIRGEKEREN